MQTKWFQLSSWRAQSAPIERANGAPREPRPAPEEIKAPEDIKEMSTATPAISGGNGSATLDTNWLPFDEMYRSAGIKTPRLGYSICKIVEMLQNEHIRSLPAETKRASLLMALEAAGVPVDEVLQDASLRQRALNSYEAIQQKHLEEYEARKAQENRAIQAEMDRVTAEYLDRINRNLDEVAHAKGSFHKWQMKKQQEIQRIAEASTLCVTPPPAQSDAMSTSRDLAVVIEVNKR
jgi:hypothetical protein